MADKLSQVTGLQVQPYMLVNPTPPTGHMWLGPTEYDLAAQRGSDDWEITVQLLVAAGFDMGAQAKLDEYLATSGPRSVKAALEDDRPGPCTLGGLVQDLHVVRDEGLQRIVTEGGVEAVGSTWTVLIYASGA